MRRIGLPLAILSIIPVVLFLVAILVPQWHNYSPNSSVSVRFGLYEICYEGGGCHSCLCPTGMLTIGWSCVWSLDGDRSITPYITFDPCYLISNGDDIHYCEFRVATFGTMISAVVLSFLALIFSFWSLRYHRDVLYTWGSYFLVAMCQFIACLCRLLCILV